MRTPTASRQPAGRPASTCRRTLASKPGMVVPSGRAGNEESVISDCIFCDIIAGRVPAQTVLADDEVVAFLDARPVFKGHLLVAPREHVETLADLPAGKVGPLFLRVQRIS